MLQQLAPMAGAKVAALEAEATNANCSRGKKVRLSGGGMGAVAVVTKQSRVRLAEQRRHSVLHRNASAPGRPQALSPCCCTVFPTLPQGKMIKAAKAEALVRRVLSHTPPGLFQHMMRTINSQVLVLLDTRRSGYVDLALLIMCLLALW